MIPVNPTPFIKYLFGKEIVVRLKWGMEYHGTLTNADAYMNLQLKDAVEYIEGESQNVMPELLIRCNNILYIGEKNNSSGENQSEENNTTGENNEENEPEDS